MFETLRADFAAAAGDRTLEKGLLRILLRVETPVVLCYRYSRWVMSLRVPVVRQLLMIAALIWQRFNQIVMGVFISPDAEIGPVWLFIRRARFSFHRRRLGKTAR